MSDLSYSAPAPAPDRSRVITVYVLYLVSCVVGVALPIGLIAAYIWKGRAPAHWRTHFHFQIRTVWLFLLYVAVGIALCLTESPLLVLGVVLLVGVWFWALARSVLGLIWALDGRPVPAPKSWLLGN